MLGAYMKFCARAACRESRLCFVTSLALASGEETNFKRQKGNKRMITDFALPRKKQMRVYGLFEKQPGSWRLRCSRSVSSGMVGKGLIDYSWVGCEGTVWV